jgi:hypothetical protein
MRATTSASTTTCSTQKFHNRTRLTSPTESARRPAPPGGVLGPRQCRCWGKKVAYLAQAAQARTDSVGEVRGESFSGVSPPKRKARRRQTVRSGQAARRAVCPRHRAPYRSLAGQKAAFVGPFAAASRIVYGAARAVRARSWAKTAPCAPMGRGRLRQQSPDGAVVAPRRQAPVGCAASPQGAVVAARSRFWLKRRRPARCRTCAKKTDAL